MKSPRSLRWDLYLPAVGAAVAVVLVLLAILAENAFRGRRDLALEGSYLRLAHRIETELRDGGPEAAGELLERSLAEEPELVAGLALVNAAGEEETRVGEAASGGARTRAVDLFLGRLRPGGTRWERRRLAGSSSRLFFPALLLALLLVSCHPNHKELIFSTLRAMAERASLGARPLRVAT